MKELISQIVQTPEQQVYLSKLLGYDYLIQYKAGKHNVVADALSRPIAEPEGQCLVLSMPNFIFLEQLQQSLTNNTEFLSLLQQIQQHPTSHIDYTIHQGLIFYKGKIWLDPTSSLKALLLEEFHNSPLSGHMGVSKTLARL